MVVGGRPALDAKARPTAAVTHLKLAEDSRAAALLARLDSSYFQLVDRLPPRLGLLARQGSTYTGIQAGEAFGGVSAMNPGITGTPWLFWEPVQCLEDGVFLQLALGGSLVVLASVLLDHIVDGQAVRQGEMVLLHQALHEEGTARLRACLAADSGFWDDFERLGAEHVVGLAAELSARSEPEQLTLDAFCAMVPFKFSPIAITMAAFCHALGQPGLLAPIELSIKHLAVASQLLDDMGDWEEDLQAGHLTYYLTQLAPPAAWQATDWPAASELQQRIDADWLDIHTTEMVLLWLERSLACVSGLPCSAWKAYLDGYCALARQHLERYGARHILRAIEPLVGSPEA